MAVSTLTLWNEIMFEKMTESYGQVVTLAKIGRFKLLNW